MRRSVFLDVYLSIFATRGVLGSGFQGYVLLPLLECEIGGALKGSDQDDSVLPSSGVRALGVSGTAWQGTGDYAGFVKMGLRTRFMHCSVVTISC